MKIAVKDANVFIDMESMGIFDLWFMLGYETVTSELIVLELEDGGHVEALAYIRSDQISVINTPLESIAPLFDDNPGISPEDASVLYIALDLNAILLTGDKTLRNVGEVMQVEVHGSIWILDQLVNKGKLAPVVAAEKLQGLIELVGSKRRFLPKKQAQHFIKKWRALSSD